MNTGGIVFISILTFGLSIWLTGILSSAGLKLGLIDRPNQRSLHHRSVPKTGGIAILAGILFGGGATFLWFFPHEYIESSNLWILAGMIMISTVSLWDDKADLSVFWRLAIHGLAAGTVIWGAELSLQTVALPKFGTLSLGVFSTPVTLLFLIWITNLYNFMDGMDGFAGGMSAIGCCFLSYIAWTTGDYFLASICLVISAGAAGFLIYNLPPARIFMGDVGSIPLGFLVGSLSLIGVRHGLYDLWVPLLIFSPFIADATITLFSRLFRGERVWHAHREHFYQRLVLAGWGHKKTVLIEYILMAACGTSGIIYINIDETGRLIILFAWAIIYLMIALGVRWVEQQSCLNGPGSRRNSDKMSVEDRYIYKT